MYAWCDLSLMKYSFKRKNKTKQIKALELTFNLRDNSQCVCKKSIKWKKIVNNIPPKNNDRTHLDPDINQDNRKDTLCCGLENVNMDWVLNAYVE